MTEVLDMRVVDELLSLCDDGDPELLLDLIKLFLDDGPAKVAAVVQGLATQDFDMMERAVHALKGSSGNLGAKHLQTVCEHMQQTTRAHKLEESRQLTARLQAEFGRARQALEALCRKYS